MNILRFLVLSFVFSIYIFPCTAQISPPGLGTTQTAFWSAIGVRQKLDAKNSSVTYIGLGRISDPEGDADPFKKQSILVLNEEIYHKINSNWQYSYALSYRRQDQYEHESPYALQTPFIHQEFRGYGRISYTTAIGEVKIKNTLRQEVRKFYTPDFSEVEDGLQLRSRFKTQAAVALDADHENSLLGSAEALFSITDDNTQGWGDYEYKESRFCLYYSYAPHTLPVVFDVGYMNDLVGHGHHLKDSNYLAVDIILENVF